MFECVVAVFLPLRRIGSQAPVSFVIAKYDFDPGLHAGDTVYINNAALIRTKKDGFTIEGSKPKFSFEAQVTRRRKIIEPRGHKDTFMLLIELEVAEKEQIPKMTKMLKASFPSEYEDYTPQP